MTNEQKQLITAEIKALCELTSQNKVANKAGVSSATISQMINGNWQLIKDEMWRKVKVKLRIELAWQTAETFNFKYLYKRLQVAKAQGLSFAVSHDAGAGKSETYRQFAKLNPNVIYIECKTYWKTKSYAQALNTACGLDDFGTTEQLVERFIDHIAAMDQPMIIIDQLDKLKDASLDFFIDFYNDLAGHCGFCLSGVSALEKRIRRGVKAARTGYDETYSRIGRKFLKLQAPTHEDVKLICEVNGLSDIDVINGIYDNCEGDMRRVKKDVQNYFLNLKRMA